VVYNTVEGYRVFLEGIWAYSVINLNDERSKTMRKNIWEAAIYAGVFVSVLVVLFNLKGLLKLMLTM
jgi:hypothetical protein